MSVDLDRVAKKALYDLNLAPHEIDTLEQYARNDGESLYTLIRYILRDYTPPVEVDSDAV